MELFEPTILFGALSSLVGIAAAFYYRSLHPLLAMACIIGVVLSHISVNILDDYVDYSSGLDKETVKTKFSGGSSLLGNRGIKPRTALALGGALFILAAAIGIYLVSRQIILLPFFIVGAVGVLFYARYLNKLPFMAEAITGLSFFSVVMGSYIVASGSVLHLGGVLFAAIPAGMQVGLILYTNEVPDRDLDKKYGRKNAIIMIWSRKWAAAFYLILEAISCLIVVAGVAIGALPPASAFVLLLMPVALAISCEMARYKNPKSYERAMANSAMIVLGFILILAVAYL